MLCNSHTLQHCHVETRNNCILKKKIKGGKQNTTKMKSVQSAGVEVTALLRVNILFVMQTTNLKIGICGGLMEGKTFKCECKQ